MAMLYTDVIATVNNNYLSQLESSGSQNSGPCAVSGKSEETVLASDPSYLSLMFGSSWGCVIRVICGGTRNSRWAEIKVRRSPCKLPVQYSERSWRRFIHGITVMYPNDFRIRLGWARRVNAYFFVRIHKKGTHVCDIRRRLGSRLNVPLSVQITLPQQRSRPKSAITLI